MTTKLRTADDLLGEYEALYDEVVLDPESTLSTRLRILSDAGKLVVQHALEVEVKGLKDDVAVLLNQRGLKVVR